MTTVQGRHPAGSQRAAVLPTAAFIANFQSLWLFASALLEPREVLRQRPLHAWCASSPPRSGRSCWTKLRLRTAW